MFALEAFLDVCLLNGIKAHQIDETKQHKADIRAFAEMTSCQRRPSLSMEGHQEWKRTKRHLKIIQGDLPAFAVSS